MNDDAQVDSGEIDAAWDDLFDEMEGGEAAVEEEDDEADLDDDVLPDLRRRMDGRLDRVMGPLLKALISTDDVTEEDLSTVLQLTATKVVSAINAQSITIYLIEDDGKIHFEYVYYSPLLWEDEPSLREEFKENAEDLMEEDLEPGTGIVGRVIEERSAHSSLNAQNDPDFNQEIMEETGFDIRSMITVPICDEDEVFGAIQVMNKDPRSGEEFFSHRDLQRLEEVARYSARIIFKSRNKGYKFDDRELAEYVARLTNCEYMDLTDLDPPGPLLQTIGEDTLRRFKMLPLGKVGVNSVRVAMANPTDIRARDMFSAATEMEVDEVVVATEKQILDVIEDFFHKREFSELGEELVQDLDVEEIDVAEDATEHSKPIVRLANQIIEDAYHQGASDIHVEPFENETRVRYRIDGICQEKLKLPAPVIKPLVARLKIMSELDISERRLPQDGRIKFSDFTGDRVDVDLRVATAPMAFGEKVVMRLLDKTATSMGLDAMGFSAKNLERYREAIVQPYGMVLHVGPTGSGKTTTLYSALTEINTPEINIQTIEDPIEYPLYGVNQLQAHQKIGLTFARALRSFLRQDPDVVLVGEIRDHETAEIAIEAALTGHLLFSTLHTNDAAGTVTRFIEMGVAPFLVASSVVCVCAQRLIRRVCSNCKESRPATPEERELCQFPEDVPDDEAILWEAPGCTRCNDTGYKGRTGVHELLVMNGDLRDLVLESPSADQVKRLARETADMDTLWEDVLAKVRDGVTTLEEAMATVRRDEA